LEVLLYQEKDLFSEHKSRNSKDQTHGCNVIPRKTTSITTAAAAAAASTLKAVERKAWKNREQSDPHNDDHTMQLSH
jgi:hypothetical protein